MSTSYCCGPGAREQRFRERIKNLKKVDKKFIPSDEEVDTTVKYIREIEHSPNRILYENNELKLVWELYMKRIVFTPLQAGGNYKEKAEEINQTVVSSTAKKI